MKTCTCLIVRRGLFFVLLCASLWPAVVSRAAVGFTLNPSSVSNTYGGTITLQVTGLAVGDTVVVQEFLDANTNGVIDGADLLVQQFNLTDGQATVIGGVTNFNVPGDTGTTAGQITARLNFQNGGLTFVGNYSYKLSSPTGQFAPITNLFTVTDFPYAQSFTGNVVNSGTNVPNAVVILFQPNSGGGGNPQGGAVANNLGSYTIKAAPGTYQLVAFKSGYAADFSAPPNLTLGSGATISTNLTLINTTRSISGKIVDAANSSIGLPGLLVPVSSTNGLLVVGFTDSNGNFTVPVTASYWKFEKGSGSLGFYGYLAPQNSTKVDTSTGSVTGVTIALPKATALFYGSVKDNLNQPLAGVQLSAEDNNQYQAQASTDENGNYVAGALGGGTWGIQVGSSQNASLANYVFSQSPLNQNGGTNLSVGQAVQVNFTALLAANHITGHVQDSNGNPISGVQINGSANINGQNYQPQVYADSGGNYSLNVPNGNWSVNLCCGCNDCGNCLSSAYQCPPNQNVNIANNNGVVNFTVFPIQPLQITTTDLPAGVIFVNYHVNVQATGGQQPYNWSIVSGSLPPGVNFGGGLIDGTPTSSGTFNFTVQATDQQGTTTSQSLSLTINPALQITTSSLPNGTNGVAYNAQLQASGGQPPYSWSLSGGSPPLPTFLNLNSDGSITGTPNTQGTFQFNARVDDANFGTVFRNLSITIATGSVQPLQVTNNFLPSGTNGAFYSHQLNASGGQQPYNWSLTPGSAPLPPILTLAADGVLSGTLATNGTFYFYARVTDAALNTADSSSPLQLTIVNPPNPPLQITNVSLPNGTVGAAYSAQLGATGGQQPYNWSLAVGSAGLPQNLFLSASGIISGTPTTTGTFNFIVQATDASFTSKTKLLGLLINPQSVPVLGSPNWLNNQFQIRLAGVTGQNYTVQLSTNVSSSNWTTLVITNSSTANSFLVTDPNATNNQRFYRALVGP